jgi:hypothetical protein
MFLFPCIRPFAAANVPVVLQNGWGKIQITIIIIRPCLAMIKKLVKVVGRFQMNSVLAGNVSSNRYLVAW